MGLVVLRGAVNGELAGQVAADSMVALVAFMGVGWVAGWVSDYLVRTAIEQRFRARVDWYRQGLIDAGMVEPELNDK